MFFQSKKIIPFFIFFSIIFTGIFILTRKDGFFDERGNSSRQSEFSYENLEVLIGGTMVKAKVADTPAKTTKGLGGVKALKDDEGMIFPSRSPGFSGFWMKDMLINIDIIWIDENLRVVDIKNDAAPDSFPEVFYPRAPALYVLEVPAGFSKKHGVEIGSEVVFSLN